MGKLSKLFKMKRNHDDVSEGAHKQQSKKSTSFKSKRAKLMDWFRRDEKQKYADLISKYSTPNVARTERDKDVSQFTESIKKKDTMLGLPSSSSTPFRSSLRSSNDSLTLNASSFDIIHSPGSLNDSNCGVLRVPLSPAERFRYVKEVKESREWKESRELKAVKSALGKSKSPNELVDATLSRFRAQSHNGGDFEPSTYEQHNGYSSLKTDNLIHGLFRRSGNHDPMQETITLDDSKTIDLTSVYNPLEPLAGSSFQAPENPHRSSQFSSPIHTENHYHTPRPLSRNQTHSSPSMYQCINQPKNQSMNDTSNSSSRQTSLTSTPIKEALSQNSSQKRMILSIQKQLSSSTRSPFATQPPPTIDLTETPERRNVSQSSINIELPPATAHYKENEERLDHAISTDFIASLVEERGQRVMERSRTEAEARVREESIKTANLAREFRQMTVSPPPMEPFHEEFYKGITGLEISSSEEGEEEEDVEEELLPTVEDLDHFIATRVKTASQNMELINKFSIPISRKDVETLEGSSWLNDEVMNFYFNLIQERSKEIDNYPKVYVYNTFFYSKLKGHPSGVSGAYGILKRWTRKTDIFAHDILLIPNHLAVHWTLTAVNVKAKKISYYDSMADGYINSNGSYHMKSILEYLKLEHQDKKKSPLPQGWSIGDIGIDEDGNENILIPQQENGCDCGVFTCRFAESISRRSPFNFDQSQMPYFRKRMIYEICNGKLVD